MLRSLVGSEMCIRDRVWKGKKMSGHMGDVKKTIQNLKIASIDVENNLLLIKGAIPGPTGSNVVLKPAVK